MSERCWRCGSGVDVDAAFCGRCGARVSAAGPEFEELTEVGTISSGSIDAAPDRGSPWLLVAGTAAIAALVAFFALTATDDPSAGPGASSEQVEPDEGDAVGPPEDEADAEEVEATSPTTTPAVDTGMAQSLSWAIARDGVPGFPFALAEVGGSVFVFVAEVPPLWPDDPRGARAFEYTRTGRWFDHGVVIGGAADVTAVVNGDDGLLATGLNGDGEPTVWRSSDGISWTSEVLPANTAALGATRPTHLVERDGVVVVASTTIDPWTQIRLAVTARLGDGVVGPSGVNWSPGVDEVEIRGPLGLRVATLGLDELGLDADRLAEAWSGPPPTPIWVYEDGRWTTNVIRGDVATLTATERGEIHLVTTADEISVHRGGNAWEARPNDTGAFRLQAWGDRFVGETAGGRIAVFDDELQPVVDTVPPSGGTPADSTIDEVAVGPLGLVTSVVEWGAPSSIDESDEPTPTVLLLRDGYRLEADPLHLLRLSRDGDEVVRVDAWADDGGYRIDLSGTEPIVVFVDPVTGVDLVTFTLDELRALEVETTSQTDLDAPTTSVFFSRDGDEWQGGEIRLLERDLPALVRVHVGSERLWAFVVTPTSGRFVNVYPDLEFALMQVEPPPP
ncbi:MAG: zinc ribbon domain-containing protein [Actinomycetota bacterium]